MPSHALSVRKIIAGGQTGADRAALDFAIQHRIEHGGWVPAGRRAEDGPLDARYQVRETPSEGYEQRTEWNVRDSDATLIVSEGPLTGGSALTWAFARKHNKPAFHADCSQPPLDVLALEVRAWLDEDRPRVLNVAGPRESSSPGIYAVMRNLLERVFAGG